jgi:uncharacterized membrane protein YsdA (DUF1294 family)
MKKVYWINYLFVLIPIGLIFYLAQRYLDLPLLYLYLITINFTAFVVFGLDKMSSRMQGQRIPEIILHLISLAGGFVGSFAGMLYFRHKTKKMAFSLIPLACLIIYLGIFYYFQLLPAGFRLN